MAKLSLIMLAAPIASFGFTIPAAAQAFADEELRPTAIVQYNDLNLQSIEGRKRLDARVRTAVQSVCDSRPNYRPSLQQRAASQACERATTSDAETKLAAFLNGNGAHLADRGGRITISAR